MSEKLIIGMDNGIGGDIAILSYSGKLIYYGNVPTIKEPMWKKPEVKFVRDKNNKIVKNKKGEKKTVTKHGHYTLIDMTALKRLLVSHISVFSECECFLERPMVNIANNWQIQSSISAGMAWAYAIHVFRTLELPFSYVDSRTYQKYFFPEALVLKNPDGTKKHSKPGERNKQLKIEGKAMAQKLFPNAIIKAPADGDALLIAEYNRLRLTKGVGNTYEEDLKLWEATNNGN